MTLVVVPVRYPLSEHSRRTLKTAIDVADEHDAALSVLHIDLYHSSKRVTQSALKNAVEEAFGPLSNTRYAVRPGFLVEETILDEIALEDADIVVIGRNRPAAGGGWSIDSSTNPTSPTSCANSSTVGSSPRRPIEVRYRGRSETPASSGSSKTTCRCGYGKPISATSNASQMFSWTRERTAVSL